MYYVLPVQCVDAGLASPRMLCATQEIIASTRALPGQQCYTHTHTHGRRAAALLQGGACLTPHCCNARSPCRSPPLSLRTRSHSPHQIHIGPCGARDGGPLCLWCRLRRTRCLHRRRVHMYEWLRVFVSLLNAAKRGGLHEAAGPVHISRRGALRQLLHMCGRCLPAAVHGSLPRGVRTAAAVPARRLHVPRRAEW